MVPVASTIIILNFYYVNYSWYGLYVIATYVKQKLAGALQEIHTSLNFAKSFKLTKTVSVF